MPRHYHIYHNFIKLFILHPAVPAINTPFLSITEKVLHRFVFVLCCPETTSTPKNSPLRRWQCRNIRKKTDNSKLKPRPAAMWRQRVLQLRQRRPRGMRRRLLVLLRRRSAGRCYTSSISLLLTAATGAVPPAKAKREVEAAGAAVVLLLLLLRALGNPGRKSRAQSKNT